VSREALLERYGQDYGNLGLAVAFTRSIEGEDAKRCTSEWDKTIPLADGPYGAGLLKNRGLTRNPAVVLRASNLIGIECDTIDGFEEIAALGLPKTVTVLSSGASYKQHYWFRPDEGCDEYAAFRFESAGITADRGRYLLIPPAIHPSGSVYAFLRAPEDQEIAVLPKAKYDEIVSRARGAERELFQRLRTDPGAKITEGQRRQTIFRFAASQQAWGVDQDTIMQAAYSLNDTRCLPPLSARQVEGQVRGALKYPSGTVEPWEIEELVGDEPDVVCLADVKPKGVEWHSKPFVQVSAFHLLAGQGGSGKGSWLASLTSAMTLGKTEYLKGEVRNVLVISTEDSAEIDLVPRIMAAGGDVQRVFTLRKSILLPRDIGYLEETIKKERKGAPTGLVIIDPVANHIGGKSTDDEGSVREAINNLNHVADRTNTAIIGVRHPTKYGDGGVTSVLGSGAWTHCPRVVLMMKQSEDVPYSLDDRVLEVVKSNRGEIGARREYRIHRVAVEGLPDLVPKLVRDFGEGP
jgi:hypothetical protein